MNELYGTLYRKALEGDADCGGLLAYGYFSGEHVTGFEEGRPLFVRTPDAKFNLANFMRVNLFTALGAIKIGMDILFKQENVTLDELLGHGGLFKTEGVGQKVVAAAVNVPVSVMKTAGEGGAWGIAVLANYMMKKDADESLSAYLTNKVSRPLSSGTRTGLRSSARQLIICRAKPVLSYRKGCGVHAFFRNLEGQDVRGIKEKSI